MWKPITYISLTSKPHPKTYVFETISRYYFLGNLSFNLYAALLLGALHRTVDFKPILEHYPFHASPSRV